jgi:catechol 2,3-dioxygenase-like lactoylglutathione lyase family enzyme
VRSIEICFARKIEKEIEMKRFHVHMRVSDLTRSIGFYTALFGQPPTVQKTDYAKWMLEDPRLNFAISTGEGPVGVEHVGFQADSREELDALTQRLKSADLSVHDEIGTTCCYAQSDKGWVHDPDQLAWESFYSFGQSTTYSATEHAANSTESAAACCTPAAPAVVKFGLARPKVSSKPNACCV